MARFNSMYQEYVKYPDVTKKRMFYEAMEDILPEIKVIIQSKDGNTSTVLPLDSFVQDDSSKSGSIGTNSNRINTTDDAEEEE